MITLFIVLALFSGYFLGTYLEQDIKAKAYKRAAIFSGVLIILVACTAIII